MSLTPLAELEESHPNYCVIPTCKTRVSRSSDVIRYCESHRKRWYIYKSRGFSRAKYEEYQTVEYCDCCGNLLKQRNMDHDHNHCPSGKWCVKCVRGVICSRCNGLLAALDDPTFMRKAMMYLELFRSTKDW